MDNFDNPRYSTDQDLYEPTLGDRLGPVGDVFKKRKKAIIALIIIAIVGYFAYDFFIGSYKTVEFSFTNYEGSSLTPVYFRVFTTNGEKLFESTNESSPSVRLKPGTYKYEARISSDYETKNESFSVAESGSEDIKFAKNIKVKISDFKENFPKVLVAGQSFNFPIEVQNKGSQEQEIAFVVSKELEKINLKVPSVTIAGNGSEIVYVSIEVPSTIKITNEKEGDLLKGNIRVKFTDPENSESSASVPSDAKVVPSPMIAVAAFSVSGDAGSTARKEFTITNNSSFAVTDLNLGVEITTGTKNPESKILPNIEFTQTQISSISGKGKTSQQNLFKDTIIFNIPIDAKKELINAFLVIQSPMFPEPKRIPFTLEIKSETSVALTLTPAPKAVNLKYDYPKGSGLYEIKSGYITVKNTGKVTIRNIGIEVKNSMLDCTTDWLTLIETDIPELKPGAERDLMLKISAPLSNDGQTMSCKIRYWYDNPIIEGEKIDDEMNDWIQITPAAIPAS